MQPISTIGELIDQHLQEHGVSEAELARRMGVSRQNVQAWRNGLRALPTHENIQNLARAVGRPYRDVLNLALAETGYTDNYLPNVPVYNLVVEEIATYATVSNTLHRTWDQLEAALIDRFWPETDQTEDAARSLMNSIRDARGGVDHLGVSPTTDFPPICYRIKRWDLPMSRQLWPTPVATPEKPRSIDETAPATIIDPAATTPPTPHPNLIYAGDLSVPDRGSTARRQRYPVEVWEVANGSVYAIITDVRGNTSLMNASERIADAVRSSWDVTAIIEYWPGGVGHDNAQFVVSSETGGNHPIDRQDLATQGLVFPAP